MAFRKTGMDIGTVKKAATLARIRLSDDDAETTRQKLSSILAMMDELGEVDTANVVPLSGGADVVLRLREDEVTDGNLRDAVLSNAPEKLEGFFVVPKVVE